MPVNEFIESNKNFQFTDLGTSFVMKIHVNSKLNIIQTYLLFIFLTFSEKGYFSNYKNLLKQISLIWKNFFPKKIFQYLFFLNLLADPLNEYEKYFGTNLL